MTVHGSRAKWPVVVQIDDLTIEERLYDPALDPHDERGHLTVRSNFGCLTRAGAEELSVLLAVFAETGSLRPKKRRRTRRRRGRRS